MEQEATAIPAAGRRQLTSRSSAGARVWGPILGLSQIDRTLWFGTRASPDLDGAEGVVHSGLGRLDLDTGEVKIFDAELPQVDYDFGTGQGKGAVSTAGVVADGARRIAVAQTGLLVIESDGKITEKPIAVPGGVNASPTGITLDRSGGRARIWAATEAGVVRLHADTFAVEKVYGQAELGSTSVGAIALDPTGARSTPLCTRRAGRARTSRASTATP